VRERARPEGTIDVAYSRNQPPEDDQEPRQSIARHFGARQTSGKRAMPDSRRRSWLDPDQGDDRPRHAASTRASAGSVFMGSSEGWRPKGFPVGTRSVHFWPRCARCGILGRGRRRLGHFGGVPPEEITPRCDWNWGPPRYTKSSSWRRL
jgi:hypothetical protein